MKKKNNFRSASDRVKLTILECEAALICRESIVKRSKVEAAAAEVVKM